MPRSLRGVLHAAVAASLVALVALGRHIRRNMGAPRAELRRCAARSPHARGGAFANREPGLPRPDLTVRQLATMLLDRSPRGRPPDPIPLVTHAPGVSAPRSRSPGSATPPCCSRWTGAGC